MTYIPINSPARTLVLKSKPTRAPSVSNKALTSNVATLTTSTAHHFVAGESVVVSGVDATFNGTFTILSTPSTTTFTYAKTASNVGSTSATGTATVSQTGNLLEWQDNSGTVLASVNSSGNFAANGKVVFNNDASNYYIQGIANGIQLNSYSLACFTFGAGVGNYAFGIGTSAPDTPLQVIGVDSNCMEIANASGGARYKTAIGVNASTGYGYVDTYHVGTGTIPLLINPNGGNVSIGTADIPGSKVTVIGDQNVTQVGAATSTALKIVNTNANANTLAELQFGYSASGIHAAISTALGSSANNTASAMLFSTRSASADANLSEKMRITAAGNVGINQTSPQTALHVGGDMYLGSGNSGSGSNTYLFVSRTAATSGNISLQTFTSGVGYTNHILLQANGGNVGIGTTSVDTALHVKAGSNANLGQLKIESTGTYSGLSLFTISADANSRRWAIQSNYTAYGTLDFLTSTTNSSNPTTAVMTINNAGSVGIGASPLSGIKFQVNVGTNQNFWVRSNSSNVQIEAATDAGNADVALRVESSALYLNATSGGNVGIGTTSTTSKLNIAGDLRISSTVPLIWLVDTSGADTGFFVFGDNSKFIIAAAADNGSNTSNLVGIDRGTGNLGVGTGTSIPGAAVHAKRSSTSCFLMAETALANSQAGMYYVNDARTWTMSVDGGNFSDDRLVIRDGTAVADRCYWMTNGDLELPTAGQGLILKSANGTRYRVTVSNAGALVVTAI